MACSSKEVKVGCQPWNPYFGSEGWALCAFHNQEGNAGIVSKDVLSSPNRKQLQQRSRGGSTQHKTPCTKWLRFMSSAWLSERQSNNSNRHSPLFVTKASRGPVRSVLRLGTNSEGGRICILCVYQPNFDKFTYGKIKCLTAYRFGITLWCWCAPGSTSYFHKGMLRCFVIYSSDNDMGPP